MKTRLLTVLICSILTTSVWAQSGTPNVVIVTKQADPVLSRNVTLKTNYDSVVKHQGHLTKADNTLLDSLVKTPEAATKAVNTPDGSIILS